MCARLAVLIACVLLAPTSVAAQTPDGFEQSSEPPPWSAPREADEPGAHEHDGFLLRVTFGVAFASLREERTVTLLDGSVAREQRRTATVTGLAIALGLDVGYALSDWLTLHLRLSQLTMPEPSSDGPKSAREERARSPLLLGPAVSAFLPANIYLTLASGYALVREAQFDGDPDLGDSGVALNLDLGWEAWMSAQWGVGVAARLWLLTVSATDAASERQRDGYALSLLLSATYQ